MSNKLIIASHNKGKVLEINELVAPLGIMAVSANEAGIAEPEETGDTFEANATLKAEHATMATGLPALADDSGLVVPAIGGQPGIYSARWAPDKDFNVAFKRIQDELKKSALDQQVKPALSHASSENQQIFGEALYSAHFICVLALCLPHGNHSHTHLFKGRIDGKLTFPPRGDKGFGYDPIFIPDGYDITFGEFDPALKNKISHRARAFEQFLQFLNM